MIEVEKQKELASKKEQDSEHGEIAVKKEMI